MEETLGYKDVTLSQNAHKYSELRHVLWIPIWEIIAAEAMSQLCDHFFCLKFETSFFTAPGE